MSYKTYTTEAIVCGSRDNNTSDKAFLLFTAEAGMLWASARSVREERSRQRYALQDFSLIRVSLVRGKSGWKAGSAECERNYFAESEGRPREARAALTAIVRLLRQFVHGEIAQPGLFTDAKSALEHTVAAAGRSQAIVDIFSLRLLHQLGYIADEPAFHGYLEAAKWWDLPPLPARAASAIDRAKQVSHL